MTHDALIDRAIKWLRGTARCFAVLSEVRTVGGETPDAIGWNNAGSWLIECKTSHSDFQMDQRKRHRRPGLGMGNRRYYMAVPGLIQPDELPLRWGLLEVQPRIIRHAVEAQPFTDEKIAQRERKILVAALRKLQEMETSDA